MSDTDNWPLLRIKLVELGFKEQATGDYKRLDDDAYFYDENDGMPDEPSLAVQVVLYKGFEASETFELPKEENEAIAWASANLSAPSSPTPQN